MSWIEDRLSMGSDGFSPDVSTEGDAMVIDCRGCPVAPVPGSDECIRCMVSCMSREGGHRRVILRTGRDIEVAGRAGEAVMEAASVMRWSYSRESPPMRCRGCPVSRDSVMDQAWAAFPKGTVAEGRRALAQESPGREGCEACVARTSAALDRVEDGLGRAVARMAASCGVVR